MKILTSLLFLLYCFCTNAQNHSADSISVLREIELARKQIEVLQKENEILRRIQKSYVEQVDSLANMCLKEGKANVTNLKQYLEELTALRITERDINQQLRDAMKDLVWAIDRLNFLLTEE